MTRKQRRLVLISCGLAAVGLAVGLVLFALRDNIVEAVMKIDERPIVDLMDLLGKVNPKAVHPASHPGIQ